jgi:hypothetical protein
MNINHPDQPLIQDENHVTRFKKNRIVEYLLDNGPFDMNKLAMLEFDDEDRQQFAQLIGYSLGGYGDLSYVSDEAYERATTQSDERRIAACLKACEGISTEVLELNAEAGGVATLERQRNEALAALNSLILFTNPTKTNAVALNHALRVAGQYKATIGQQAEQ